MSELHHECGVIALYHLPGRGESPLCPAQGADEISRLAPRMLLDVQNRGQLSAGVDFQSGADAEAFLARVAAGEKWGATSRKVTLTPQHYPGLDALLARAGA